MKIKSLWERCKLSGGKGENSFVGIERKNNNIYIKFPMGYRLEKTEDEVIRKEILSLLHILKKFNSNKGTNENKIDKKNSILEFPLLSYQYIVLDFLSNGYYSEKEVSYTSSNKGKINWKRTIQKKKPYISDEKAIYLEFITKKNVINENTILRSIHEICVYDSFLKIGWLYSDVIPPKPRIELNENNKKMFISILKSALNQTFNDNKRQLFTSMINIIKPIKEGDVLSSDFSFGTNYFEFVWEKMIDSVFGNVFGEEKKKYFPKASWTINGEKPVESSSLYPDTIIKDEDEVYIIDAKYYKYEITKNSNDLPSTSSIQKQITYGEYLVSDKFKEKNGKSFSPENVYNAFIMPFDKKKNEESENYKYIGYATADWKASDENNTGNGKKGKYEKILGILLDTKHLMENCQKQNGVEKENLLNEFIKKVKEIFNETNLID